ncbi:ketosteroid isomerase-like protein [Lewinella marina]|nr:nuclear transport factor 2 family protein [Neolewinella marina]NJB84506.1 ketosteroid isomerase-like protein [Neolewinella marina]
MDDHSPDKVFDAFRHSTLAGDDQWHEMLTEKVTFTGPLSVATGRDQFIENRAPFYASVRGGELHRRVVDGHTVITQVTVRIAAPGGGELPLDICEWYKIRDGKVAALHVYYDTAALRSLMEAERRQA